MCEASDLEQKIAVSLARRCIFCRMPRMSLSADLFWSFRSPYSYLAIGRYRALMASHDVTINLRPVYPLAVRQPDFFERNHPNWLSYTMRDMIRREDLTDEQRRELRSNMRDVFRTMMRERMDAWYAAETDAEKTAILDQQIDEFEARRAEWERRRAEAEESEEGRADRERFRQMFATPSKEERKARSESRNPDQTARMMGYFSAMRKRMEQRGIQPPGGPGGRGGWGRR